MSVQRSEHDEIVQVCENIVNGNWADARDALERGDRFFVLSVILHLGRWYEFADESGVAAATRRVAKLLGVTE